MSTIDLQSFCARDDVRSYLMTPFVIDGHTYATNGHIAVRVLGGEPDPEQTLPERVREAVLKMFATEYTDFEPLPEVPSPRTCTECAGTGEVAGYECGNPPCRDGELFKPMKIGVAFFDVRYLHRISKLPNARIRVVGPEAVAAFIFDGGEGRVMPCRGL